MKRMSTARELLCLTVKLQSSERITTFNFLIISLLIFAVILRKLKREGIKITIQNGKCCQRDYCSCNFSFSCWLKLVIFCKACSFIAVTSEVCKHSSLY